MLPAIRDGNGTNYQNVTGDGNHYHTIGEPLFRPFISYQYNTPWRRPKSKPDNFLLLEEDLLSSGPPGFTNHVGMQSLIPMNMPMPPQNAEAVCGDDIIDDTQSHPQFNNNSRAPQQVDSTHKSPSHKSPSHTHSQDGSWRAPERTVSTRFWSMSEQLSLINAAEKCIVEDKCWDSGNRWATMYAHMCDDGHEVRSENKLNSKFAHLTKDYQRIRAWNANKQHIPYEELPGSQRKSNGLPIAYVNYLYKRMTNFFKNTNFDELHEKEDASKSSKVNRSSRGVKTRASSRLNKMENTRNSTESMMQQKHENADGVGNINKNVTDDIVDVDDAEKVYGESDHQGAKDKESSDEIANGHENVHLHEIVREKQGSGRTFTNGFASKERKPPKKQRVIPNSRKGIKHQAGYGGEDPVEPTQVYSDKEQFYRPNVPTQKCMGQASVNEAAFMDLIKSSDSSIAEMIPIMSTISQACNQFSQAFSQTVMMKAALVQRLLSKEN